ncbi:hypothetical protein Droror1_Dr00026877, partial [Drosera rotundifolia]
QMADAGGNHPEPNRTDPTWEHCLAVSTGKNSRLKMQCNYCGKIMSGGVSRMKLHLAGIHGDG